MPHQLTQSDAERLYHELGALVWNAPPLDNGVHSEVAQWCGRVAAILELVPGGPVDAVNFAYAADNLDSFVLAETYRDQMQSIVYRALARLERRLPLSSANTFIGAGEAFSALTSLSNVVSAAKESVLFVDPYAARNLLSDFAIAAVEGVEVHVLAGDNQAKPDLLPAAEAWVKQYGLKRPLDVRLAPRGTIHDRAVFVDRREAWTVGTSFNGLGKSSPTLMQKVDPNEVFPDKLEAYTAIWAAAKRLL